MSVRGLAGNRKSSDRGRKAAIGLVVVACFASAGQVPGAAVSIPPIPYLTLDAGVAVSPKRLPRNEHAPIALKTLGEIQTADGAHPSALREAIVDVDRDVRLDVAGIPVCTGRGRELRPLDTKRLLEICGEAVVGKGSAHFEIAFPEQKPLIANPPVTVLNGGERDGKVTLFIHAFIGVPRPAAIVAVATVQRKDKGLHSVVKIPVVAGGSGSLVDFEIRFGRSHGPRERKAGLIEARCPDGRFKVNVPKILFKNEAKIPSVAPTTILKGSLLAPCIPKG